MPHRQLTVVSASYNEKIVHGICLVSLFVYSMYSIYNDSKVLPKYYTISSWFDLKRDNSYQLWNEYLKFIFDNINIVYLLFTVVVDKLCKTFCSKYYKVIMSAYSLFVMVKVFTLFGFALPFTLSIITYGMVKMTASKWMVWGTILISMYLYESRIMQENLSYYFRASQKADTFIYMYQASMFFLLLRIISFCSDKIDGKPYCNFQEYFLYLFFPTFTFCSPFIKFQNFKDLFIRNIPFSIRNFISMVLYILFNSLLIELALHLTQAFAINEDQHLFKSCSLMTLAAALFLKGSLFAVIYNVMYGIPKLVNDFVGVSTTDLPRYIAFIHTNGEMWKYFDTGFYEFIKYYLYIPLGGNRIGTVKQLLSLVLSFGYVSFWHGTHNSITLWTFLNFVMVVIELIVFKYVVKNVHVSSSISNMSPSNQRRLICFILGAWQVILHMISFLFLNSNMHVSYMIYKRILCESFPWAFILGGIGYYCTAQFRIDYVPFYVTE